MADYDIYREQLAIKYSTYGHALWQPRPSNPNNPVKIGDVGFIRNGKFVRLFNALISAEDQSNVPEHYEQLVPKFSDHISEDTLSSHHYCSDGINVELESNVHASCPDDFEKVSFSNPRRRGAVLSLPVDARRKDTLAKGDFSEWIVKHIDHCLAFAQGLGLGMERMEELILVTGCDHTRSWTNVAFFGSQHDGHASFGFRVVHGPPDSIYWQSSPEPVRGGVVHRGPDGTNLPEDQCVFVRGFRVARTFWKLRTHLKAAAGPSSDEEGDDCEPDTEVVSIPAVSKYRDPLHILQDYIAERAPDCDMSLVHDDDLVEIDELGHGRDASLETHGREVMMDLLRKCDIKIHKVSYESSLSNSCPNTEKSGIKLAMLPMTSQIWNTAPPSPSVREGNTPRMPVVSTSTSRRRQVASPGPHNQATFAISPFRPSHSARVPCHTEALQEPHVDKSLRSEHVLLSADEHPHTTGNTTSYGPIRGHQSQVVSPTVQCPTEVQAHSGLGQQSHAPDYQNFVTITGDDGSGPSGGHFPLSSGQPPFSFYDNMTSSGRRSLATNSPPQADAGPKKCRIPDCTYNAHYDISEQEQTEYCGQGHELQALATGLVASCAVCKGRPRRNGERVCGRTCRERERQARSVGGSYYGVPIVRRDSRCNEDRLAALVQTSPTRAAIQTSPTAIQTSPMRAAIQASPTRAAVQASPTWAAIQTSPTRAAIQASPTRAAVQTSPTRADVQTSPKRSFPPSEPSRAPEPWFAS